MNESFKIGTEDAWEECLKMWRWIVKEYDPSWLVADLKARYFEEVLEFDDPNDMAWADSWEFCYFCKRQKYLGNRTTQTGRCADCPGVEVDPGFSCMLPETHFLDHPDKFLAKIELLNEIRLKSK